MRHHRDEEMDHRGYIATATFGQKERLKEK
jgi:hypothetical protein